MARRIGNSRSFLAMAMSDFKLSPGKEEKEVLESLNSALDGLYAKRRSARETALSSITENFTCKVQYVFDFAKENFVNLLHRYLNSIKHGSEKERWLACGALGLLALTAGSGNKASELVKEESFTVISRALTCNSEWWIKAKILDCLAIITFVGGGCDQEETGRAMKLIWQYIHPKHGSNVVSSSALTAKAISAWSFLVTSMAGWTLIDSESWQKLASHFSSLLEAEDRLVRMAAGDALALLFEIEDEIEDLEDFSGDAMETLKQKIFLQVEALSIEAGGRGVSKKNLKDQRVYFKQINEFIQKRHCPNTSMTIGRLLLEASTWSGWKQWKFLYHFLEKRYGFHHFVEKNELLVDFFEFTTKKKKKIADKKEMLSIIERMVYIRRNSNVKKVRKQELKKQCMLFQMVYKRRNSNVKKVRKQELKKQCMLFQRNIMDTGLFD